MTIYFIYAFICHTEIGKELKIENSPVAEINNGQYFYLIASLLVVDLVVALIATTDFDSVVLALLEVMYELLFARYIYLYKEYSDNKQTRKQVKKTHVKKCVIVEDTSSNKEGDK